MDTAFVNSIKIGGVVHRVKFVPDFKDDGRPLDGQIDHGQALITIKANMDKQVQAQTVLHEVLHAIEAQTGRRHELKEPMIDALAYGIYQVLRDNPELVRMIVK